jgi:hypothetical protein
MYDIVEGLHKALRIESTWQFVLAMALGAAVVAGFFAWIIDTGYRNSPEFKASHEKASQKPDNLLGQRSYLDVELAIDRIDKNTIQFHFSLHNIGPSEIKVLHLAYQTRSMTATEGNMEPVRTIIPQGHLVSNGSIPVNDTPGTLLAMATYVVGNDTQPFTVTLGFPIRPIDLHAKNILASSSREESAGETFDSTQKIVDGLRQATGSLVFWFPEKLKDGSSNDMLVAVDERRIAFDPLSRTVQLTMPSMEKLVHLEKPGLELMVLWGLWGLDMRFC